MMRALEIGSSGGIGRALVGILSDRGVKVTGLSRSEHGLDIRDEGSIAAAFKALSEPFDLIIATTGALEIDGLGSEKTLRAVTPEGLRAQFETNTLGPALILKHALPLLPRDGRSVFAALSARVGSIGDNRLGGWYSYRMAKAALNQIVRTSAVELARTHNEHICVALHPGTVKTTFTEKYLGNRPAVGPVEAATNLLNVIDGLTPADSGGFFDWQGKVVPW